MPACSRAPRGALVVLVLSALAVLGPLAPSASASPSAAAAAGATTTSPTRAQRVVAALKVARHQVGDPYQYGAAGPHRFDCSGLTYYSFRKEGFGRIPRTAAAQARYVHHERRTAMHPGDLIFFTDHGSVYHVGLYVGRSHGHRLVLHAPHTGAHVRVERVWTDHWFPGTLRR